MDFKFYNAQDRAILRGEDPDKEPDWNAYKKVPRRIPKPKKVLDEDGFYMPVPDTFSHKETGLCCDMFGVTPENVATDMLALLGEAAKEIYETEMRHLTWHIRCDEVTTVKNFAQLDQAVERCNASDEVKSGRKKPVKPAGKKEKKKILRSVTWKYDWIQLYKKDCYLFADYVIKWQKGLNNPEQVLAGLSEEESEMIVDACQKRGTEKLEGRLRLLAEAYMACEEQREKEDAFCEGFMAWADNLPEMNRSLVDFMYETAWYTIMNYFYGETDAPPAPLYSVLYSDQLDEDEDSICEDFDDCFCEDDEEPDELEEEFLCGPSDDGMGDDDFDDDDFYDDCFEEELIDDGESFERNDVPGVFGYYSDGKYVVSDALADTAGANSVDTAGEKGGDHS